MNAANDDQQELVFSIDNLQQPGTFSHPVTHLEVLQTHISRIILTGEFAYKIKKPVQLGFIDTSTLQRRRELCELELRLNRRLASELYVSVVPIVLDAPGQIRFGGSGEAFEYAVCMRQFDGEQELQNLLLHNAVSVQEIQDLAVRLADFHEHAAQASGEEYGSTVQIRATVLGNLRRLLEYANTSESLPGLEPLVIWTENQLLQLETTLEARRQCGAVRECHGDLHARNIVRWRGQLIPFDCLEFDPQLRFIDVMNDVAFLVMDLAGHGRSDLAYAFLSSYLEAGGDYAGVRLLPFYAVYRASVRAMVDALSAQQTSSLRPEYLQRLKLRLHTALQFIERPAPALLIMQGVSGSGKTWLSERLVKSLPAVRIRSDVERKRLAGIDMTTVEAVHVHQGRYSPAFSHRTYARLLDAAEACLQGGVTTVVDAAFLDATDRRLFYDLAQRLRVQFLIVSCSAAPEVLASRIELRQRQHSDASEANGAVLAQQLRDLQPLTDYEQPHVVTVNTADDAAVDMAVEQIRYRAAQLRP